eukprot:2749900-Pyramimonas_sp.AAC.1
MQAGTSWMDDRVRGVERTKPDAPWGRREQPPCRIAERWQRCRERSRPADTAKSSLRGVSVGAEHP